MPGVSAPGGVCSRVGEQGVCSGGVSALGGSALGGVSRHALRQTTPPGRRLLLRTVRILLECILVTASNYIVGHLSLSYHPRR